MSTAAELVARCGALGIELGVSCGGAALVWEWEDDPPADLLADLTRHKAAVLALVRGPHGNCDRCGRPLDEKRRCWHCHDRVCVDCRGWTGSAFIQRCVTCGFHCRDE
jgi:hypothetical protein